VQDAAIEIDLVPAQLHQLGRSQAVAEGQEDHRGVPVAARRLDQALDLDLGEMLSGAIFAVGPAQRRLNCRIFAWHSGCRVASPRPASAQPRWIAWSAFSCLVKGPM
jgi:hypothetical protein